VPASVLSSHLITDRLAYALPPSSSPTAPVYVHFKIAQPAMGIQVSALSVPPISLSVLMVSAASPAIFPTAGVVSPVTFAPLASMIQSLQLSMEPLVALLAL
jgi:hypothetical protein